MSCRCKNNPIFFCFVMETSVLLSYLCDWTEVCKSRKSSKYKFLYTNALEWAAKWWHLWVRPPDTGFLGSAALSVDRWVPPWSTLGVSWHPASGAPDWVLLGLHQDNTDQTEHQQTVPERTQPYPKRGDSSKFRRRTTTPPLSGLHPRSPSPRPEPIYGISAQHQSTSKSKRTNEHRANTN